MMPIMIAVFGLLLAGQFFLAKNKQTTPASTQQTQTAKTPEASPAAGPAATPRESASASETPAAATPVAAASAETETVVENDLYRIVFTNRGAQAKHWILKKYKDDKGQPLDLVNASTANLGLPLSLYAYDEALRNKINSALYVASASGTLAVPGELTFEFSDGTVAVHKTLRFDTSYVVGVETTVTVSSKPVQAYPSWPAGFGDQGTAPSFASARIDYSAGDSIERLAAKKISGGNTLRGPFQWAGPQDQYFAAIFLPDQPAQAAMVTFRNTIEVPKDPSKPDPNNLTKVEILGAAVGNVDGVTRERIFVGPKALKFSTRCTPTS